MLLDERRRTGDSILDLTEANPTAAGFNYPEDAILSSLSDARSLRYEPDPRGLLSARNAVTSYYRSRGRLIEPSNIFLTAGTSEAYSLIFKILCNPGDGILVPRPSYPLFEYLARIDDVALQPYRLRYEDGWRFDFTSLRETITPASRAIVLVDPHNPTGMSLRTDDRAEIARIARKHSLALIVDEVFSEYRFDGRTEHQAAVRRSEEPLTFTLNGISKMLGLPQMKLGWIALSGESAAVLEAGERLEIVCDTFLSVNTPAQLAFPELMRCCDAVRSQILGRVRSNRRALESCLDPRSGKSICSLLSANGGWYAIVRLPRIKTDEEWALDILKNTNVYVQPGYFFDFDDEGYLVMSLLAEENSFEEGIRTIFEYVESCCSSTR